MGSDAQETIVSGAVVAAVQLLESGKDFSAVFSSNDACRRALRAFRDAGKNFPGDVSVVASTISN
jgi:DNA-binding LacI/PurR family transcriptional regulator